MWYAAAWNWKEIPFLYFQTFEVMSAFVIEDINLCIHVKSSVMSVLLIVLHRK